MNGNTINHLAIIMDGNRRWANERGLPKLLGHTEGAKTLKKIAEAVHKRKIPYLTIWALSTENLKNRSDAELKHLFSLFNQLTDYLDDFFKKNARCTIIGDISKLPKKTRDRLQRIVDETKDNSAMTLTLAINYGGRDELLRALRKTLAEVNSTFLPLVGGGQEGVSTMEEPPSLEDLEMLFSNYLDTRSLPDPDLIIRTGGHQRLSGFMPWQSVYSELYFTGTYWPAFTETDLDAAITWYKKQQQNRGI